MKKCRIYVVLSIVGIGSLLGMGLFREKEPPKNLQDYIGKSYEEGPPKALLQQGVEIKYGNDDIITGLRITCQDYAVNAIRVGDSIEKIKEVYPQAWMDEKDDTIKIAYGKDSHYGITTGIITYEMNNNQVKSITIGQTADFIDLPLPSSNEQAQQLLQGTWQSADERILRFEEDYFEDNYMEPLWDQQSYQILTPNKLLVSRNKEDQYEKLTLNFWLDESTLYLFTTNDQGEPIEKSIEVFSRF